MGTIKRLKDAEDRLKTAEDAVPGAYESRYTGQVGDQLSQMGAQNAAGFDYDTTNEAYQQYRARVAQNAQDAATAATNTAQSLAGGYGADWAASAANQAAAGQTAAAGTSLSDLRSQALQQWQNELSNENNLVDTLLGQDAQERSTAGMNTGAAQNWRDYLSSRAGQARQENSDFWSNVWNSVLNVGNAIKTGYDGYMGYTQQQWENQFKEKQYNDSLSRTQLSDQIAAMEQAQAFKQAGFDELAQQTLAKYGLDSTMLDAWSGLTDTQKDQMAALVQGANLAASGNDVGADSYLKLAGLDTGSIDHYSTVAGRQNASEMDLYKQKQAADLSYNTSLLGVKSRYSGSSSGSSGRKSSSQSTSQNQKQSVTYTGSQINQMAKDYQTMDPSDSRYAYYGKTLADNGVIPRLTGTGNPGKANGTAFEQGIYKARQMANSGSSKDEIANYLAGTNLSDSLVATIMNQIEAEWR